MSKTILTLLCLACSILAYAGDRFNFNGGWKVRMGDTGKESSTTFDDSGWKEVTLPYSYNGTEAFAKNIRDHTDTVGWYRKTFVLPKNARGKKYFIEFEGVRQAAHVFLNGHELGWSENGVMAFGFDLTPYINADGKNVLAVFIDNNWRYKEKKTGKGYEWNDRNFNVNYGGITKNVWLHVMGDVYQTLPLYSNLQTTGTYVYASDFDIPGHKAVIHAESEVRNESPQDKSLAYEVAVVDRDGKTIATFRSAPTTIKAGATATLKAQQPVSGLHFWSLGYGYLYDVKTRLIADGKCIDEASTRTGFRQTHYGNGMVELNGRTLQLKGFAQRSSNEWPAVGNTEPAWMSDYSNSLILGCNGNFMRWMHVTPSKQDINSFDRLGLVMAMPAGDAEKDAKGRQWEQRVELMRDAIIYNRNNPSIMFYESGNNQISEQHMQQMKDLRDKYDPFGGRAAGSRNMRSSKVAEYGGEMLYINKSDRQPFFQMEFCRDEGIRMNWDDWSFPFHKEGDGPLFRGEPATSYNHNMDAFMRETVRRWNEYYLARPGAGRRVNAGGAKIIFSDSNTHFRGAKNYRTSGDVDAMRLPKDPYYAHQVMWSGWVDLDKDATHIAGHWNYPEGTVKPVNVVSTSPQVELFVNGKSQGKGKRSDTFLFSWDNVKFEPGTITAVGLDDNGNEQSRDERKTVGKPVALKMHWIDVPAKFRADGQDIRIAEVEAVDKDGNRYPIDDHEVSYTLSGNGEWLGGVSGYVADSIDNRILSKKLRLEAGVSRVMVRSTTNAGKITLKATTNGLKGATLTINTANAPMKDGFYTDASGNAIEAAWGDELPSFLAWGETPSAKSYKQRFNGVSIASAEVACDTADVQNMWDDYEETKWISDGKIQDAWVRYHLSRPAKVSQIVIRLEGFRKNSYPLEIKAGDDIVWSGWTDKGLGYAYININKPVSSDTYTIRMVGPATVKEAFGDVTELAAKNRVDTKAGKSKRLGIFEIEFNETSY